MKQSNCIHNLTKEDYQECARIYQEGLDTGIATFETDVPSWEVWDKKYLEPCRYTYQKGGKVWGWIALTPFSSREVYRGVAEVSLYVAQESQGKGVGKQLLQYLIDKSKSYGFWTLQAKIFPQNERSIGLFIKRGFRKVGMRERIAMRDGVWYDNILLERRA